jgi:hypothetical protein
MCWLRLPTKLRQVLQEGHYQTATAQLAAAAPESCWSCAGQQLTPALRRQAPSSVNCCAAGWLNAQPRALQQLLRRGQNLLALRALYQIAN